MLGDLVGQGPRRAGDDDFGLDHRRNQAVIHARGRRLDPLQLSLADDAVPIDRHLGVAAEDVGGEDFRGNLLLRGVDDLGLRHDCGNLLQVTGLGDVAENDAHGRRESWWGKLPIVGFPSPPARSGRTDPSLTRPRSAMPSNCLGSGGNLGHARDLLQWRHRSPRTVSSRSTVMPFRTPVPCPPLFHRWGFAHLSRYTARG